MSDPEEQPDSDRSGSGFWTSLPGILTGLAALLTAVVALMPVLRESDPDPVEPPVATAPAVSAPAATPSEDPSPPATSPGVFAEGRITMRTPDSVDLERGLVGSSPDGYDLYLYCSGTDCILNAMRSLMAPAESADSKDSCIAAMKVRQEQALNSNQMREGQTLCIQTEDGHVGRLQLLKLPGPGSIDFEFSYTLWL